MAPRWRQNNRYRTTLHNESRYQHR
jgi:hypothetical protein